MKIPMREKYVDEAVGVYIVMGWHPDGQVDVMNQDRDIFCKIPAPVAEAVCEAQAEFRNKLYQLLCNHAL